ncbi:MAG: ABC transporter ATP-binding protein [Clostridia bacterium]|nr:ABC transporter ATP-binding protein [Clostridia bacterium]
MLKLLKRLGKKEIIFVCICIIFVVVQVWLELSIPDYMSEITKLVQTEGSKMQDILKQGAYMLACAFGSLISSVIVGYFAANIAAAFSRDLRKDVFRKVEEFGMEEVKSFSTSSLITRTTNDIMQVQMLIAIGLQVLIRAPIMAIWAITKIAGKAYWQWSTITVVAVGVLLTMIGVLVTLVLPRFKKVQRLTDNLNKVTRENLTGIRVIRAYNAEEYQEDKFEKANEELKDTQLFNQRILALMNPVMTSIMSGISLAIYFSGAYIIDSAQMLDKLTIFSDMVVFSSYAIQVVMSFMMLSMIFIIYPRASVSAQRILEVLTTKVQIRDGKRKSENIKNGSEREEGTVEFKNVSFKYPDAEEYMLENISFKVNKGETIAFIGSTGSGKSTLINLVPRFYDATEGEVLVDGINVKDYTLEELNNKLGYVPQRAVMFSDTVAENVAYGDNGKEKPNEEKIKQAVEIAQGKEFVEQMESKYNSHIAQGGTNISGGQKQRLAIARAIAREPEIYIFDDSFSALDYKTDYVLRKELKKHTKDVTNMIVAQRIGTIKDADKIVVLDEGKMVGFGTHQELLKNCEVYKEIAYSQLSKDELGLDEANS